MKKTETPNEMKKTETFILVSEKITDLETFSQRIGNDLDDEIKLHLNPSVDHLLDLLLEIETYDNGNELIDEIKTFITERIR